MASITSGFSGFGNVMQWIMYAGWFLLFVFIVGIFTALVIFFVIKAKEKTLIEIDMETKRMKFLAGRERSNKSKRKQLWIGKYKKFLPKLQSSDIFIKGKKDIVLMLKDKNGLRHTLRVPSYEQLKKWYEVQYNIDIDKKAEEITKDIKQQVGTEEFQRSFIENIQDKFKHNPLVASALNVLHTIYLLPNPSEDLNWLADDCIQADKTFTSHWWQSPAFIWGTTIMGCIIIFLMTMIIAKKM